MPRTRRYDMFNWDEEDWGYHIYGDDYNPNDPLQRETVNEAMEDASRELDRRIDEKREERYNWDDQ